MRYFIDDSRPKTKPLVGCLTFSLTLHSLLDPSAIPTTAMCWDFTELEPVPGILSRGEAVQRAVSASPRPLEAEVGFEAVFGRLTSLHSGRLTAGGEFVPTCKDRQVWVVRCTNVKMLKSQRPRGPSGSPPSEPPHFFYGNRWLVVDARSGDLLLSADC